MEKEKDRTKGIIDRTNEKSSKRDQKTKNGMTKYCVEIDEKFQS